MMKMNNREEIYSYLKQYDREYSLAKNSEERDRIENNVRNFAEGLDDEIYLELNNNALCPTHHDGKQAENLQGTEYIHRPAEGQTAPH